MKADPTGDPKVTREVLRKAYKETDPDGSIRGQRKSTLDFIGQLRLRYLLYIWGFLGNIPANVFKYITYILYSA